MPPKRKSSLTLLSGWCLAALATMAIAAAAPTPAADLNKTLRVSFPIAETGFDPAPVGDIYSQYVNRAIFDPLYRYDYLARPYKIVPNAAAAMPQITPDGKTWTIKIKPGIYFADDPAFNGKKRELTAADYVYSWKRVIDPKMRSNNIQVFDGKIKGLFLMGQNPAVGGHNARLVRQGLANLDWLVVRDAFETETAAFWYASP